MKPSRRELLLGLVGSAVACATDGAPNGPEVRAPGSSAAAPCANTSDGGAQSYCLATALVVRVPGASALQLGQALLFNVDDTSAVIVARDEGGFYARSGICTHACCVVALCSNASCNKLTPSPLGCSPSAWVSPDADSGIVCPCHGSAFRLSDGKALTGPARTPLPSYALNLDGSDALVDTGRVVDPSTRA